MKPFICLITGPAGVGKTTVANALAKEFPKTARINVDELRHCIIRGKVHPFPSTEEAEHQLRLAIKNAASLAKNYNDAGFHVFIDDVVADSEKLTMYLELTVGYQLRIFLLICDQRCLIARDSGRKEEEQMGARSLELSTQFLERDEEHRWLKIDTSKHSIQETLEAIRQKLIESDIGY